MPVLELILIGGLSALLAFAVATYTPRLAFGIIWGRRILFGFFVLIGSVILIATSQPGLMAAGGAAIFIIALILFYESPQDDVW